MTTVHDHHPRAAPVPAAPARSAAAPAASGPAPAADPVKVLGMAPGGGLAAARAVMAAVDGIAPGPGGLLRTTYLGREITMTPAQAEQVRAGARTALRGALQRCRSREEYALGRYHAQEKVDDEFPVTSHLAGAWAYVSNWGDYGDPGEALGGLHVRTTVQTTLAQGAIAGGEFSKALSFLAEADAASERAAKLVGLYIDKKLGAAEGIATGLEYTSQAAFITLGVLAVVATGGAALGAAPEVIGAGIAGTSLSTTVTVISVGAPIVASVGTGVVQMALGDKVDWTKIAVQAAIDIVIARFGGKLTQGVLGKLAGNPATQTLARQALGAVVRGVATHEVSQAFTSIVHNTVDALRGRDVTWGSFVDDLEHRLTDPKGLFLAVAMSGVHLGAEVKVQRSIAERSGSGAPAKGSGGGTTERTSTPASKPGSGSAPKAEAGSAAAPKAGAEAQAARSGARASEPASASKTGVRASSGPAAGSAPKAGSRSSSGPAAGSAPKARSRSATEPAPKSPSANGSRPTARSTGPSAQGGDHAGPSRPAPPGPARRSGAPAEPARSTGAPEPEARGLPAGVRTSAPRRRGMQIIDSLPPKDRAFIRARLAALPPKEAGKLLTALGSRGDPARLKEVLAEFRAGAPAESEGPAAPRSALDDSASHHLGDDHGLQVRENRPPARISPKKPGVNRGNLKNRMIAAGEAPTWAKSTRDWNPHHVIPVSLENHPVLETLRANGGWDNNAAVNGYPLPTRPGIGGAEHLPVHQVSKATTAAGGPARSGQTARDLGGHPVWNDKVKARLDALEPLMSKPDQLRVKVLGLIDDLKGDLELAQAQGRTVLF